MGKSYVAPFISVEGMLNFCRASAVLSQHGVGAHTELLPPTAPMRSSHR